MGFRTQGTPRFSPGVPAPRLPQSRWEEHDDRALHPRRAQGHHGLSADLAGSTALGVRLDPEDAREIVGGALARVIEAIEELGGTIKDLAGDGVLALFGAPVLHEDDKERAVRAGLRIVEEMTRYADKASREWDLEALSIRVGIESGLVVVGPLGAGERIEYGAVGDAVNTACRLQSETDPNTV